MTRARPAGPSPDNSTSAERWYTMRVLPGAIGRGLLEAAMVDPSGALRSAVIIAGFCIASVGFAVGCLTSAGSGRATSPEAAGELAVAL